MQVLQGVGGVGVDGLAEIPQDGLGALEQQVQHRVLDGAVILHLVDDQVLNQPALLQAGKGRLQVEVGVDVVPLQHALLEGLKKLGPLLAQLAEKRPVGREGGLHGEHLPQGLEDAVAVGRLLLPQELVLQAGVDVVGHHLQAL